jgi:hypothetical protein
MGPDHEWLSRPCEDVQRGRIARLDEELAAFGETTQLAQVGFGLHQCHRGEPDLLSRSTQVRRKPQPIVELHFTAARAHDLSEHDGVGRGVRQVGVERRQFLAGPVGQHRTDRDAELATPTRHLLNGLRIHRYRHGRSYAPRVCCWPSARWPRAAVQSGWTTYRSGAAAAASIAWRQTRVTCST